MNLTSIVAVEQKKAHGQIVSAKRRLKALKLVAKVLELVPKKHRLSPAGRRRISQAAMRRWARHRKLQRKVA